MTVQKIRAVLAEHTGEPSLEFDPAAPLPSAQWTACTDERDWCAGFLAWSEAVAPPLAWEHFSAWAHALLEVPVEPADIPRAIEELHALIQAVTHWQQLMATVKLYATREVGRISAELAD
jgi:hypothetical protein